MSITPKSPSQRMTDRQTAGSEVKHSEMGNGSLFNFKSSVPRSGSTAYGPLRRMHLIDEASVDGGVQTQDRDLAAACRGLGIYTETKL